MGARQPAAGDDDQYFWGPEQDKLDRQLTPLTQAQRSKVQALVRSGLAQLDKWSAGPLGKQQRISAAVMRWSLSNTIANERFDDHSFVFSQFSGVHIGLVNFMNQTHPMRTASGLHSCIARLEQVAPRIDEALVRARSAAARSLLPPRFILERAQDQVKLFLKDAAPQNGLIVSLGQRAAALPDLNRIARAAAIGRATRIVELRILPADARVQALLAEIHPRTGDVAGIARLPDGAAAYGRTIRTIIRVDVFRTRKGIHLIALNARAA